MNILDIIEKKKNGQKLSKQEIQFFVDGICSGKIKDFQTTSLLMAICLNGIDFDETYNLTISMAKSGEMLDLTDVGNCVDKHSTGGVSDTTTLVIVPILASLGVKVAKMSGRKLGFTGGTADKMEVFVGYNTEISTDQFKDLIVKNNASIVSQSENFALADKIIYKLRSESGTVENIGLIASSIMSKKIACGAKTIILDCKYGNGAFMKNLEACKKLAETMVNIGKMAGIKVCAILSNMNQPLTKYVGNNLEVYSALQVLGGTENNLAKLSKFICAKVLIMQNLAQDQDSALKMIDKVICDGSALKKLKQIVASQGGSVEVIDNPNLLLPCNKQIEIFAKNDGYVESIDTSNIGKISHDIQKIDGVIKTQNDAGIVLNVEIGDTVKAGDLLCKCHFNTLDNEIEIKTQLENCFLIGTKHIETKLIEGIIE